MGVTRWLAPIQRAGSPSMNGGGEASAEPIPWILSPDTCRLPPKSSQLYVSEAYRNFKSDLAITCLILSTRRWEYHKAVYYQLFCLLSK